MKFILLWRDCFQASSLKPVVACKEAQLKPGNGWVRYILQKWRLRISINLISSTMKETNLNTRESMTWFVSEWQTFEKSENKRQLNASLTKWTRKSTQINASFRLAVTPPTALTCVDFSRARIRTQVTVWPPNASRHKLIASHLYMREIYDFFATCESIWPPIASTHASSGFANFGWLASPLGQGIRFGGFLNQLTTD